MIAIGSVMLMHTYYDAGVENYDDGDDDMTIMCVYRKFHRNETKTRYEWDWLYALAYSVLHSIHGEIHTEFSKMMLIQLFMMHHGTASNIQYKRIHHVDCIILEGTTLIYVLQLQYVCSIE